MSTVIDICPEAITWCRIEQGRLIDVGRQQITDGQDPLEQLKSIEILQPIGPTKVLVRHSDILVRPLMEGAASDEQLERIIGFELRSMMGEAQQDAIRFAFRPAQLYASSGDLRVTTLVTKQDLIDKVASAVKGLGGKLTNISHPLTGMYAAFKRQHLDEHKGKALLVHADQDQFMILAIEDGELLTAVNHNPGMQDLADLLSEKGFNGDWTTVPSNESYREELTRMGMNMAGAINAKLRMLKAQIRLLDFAPTEVFLSGLIPGTKIIADQIAKLVKVKVTIINPFVGVGTSLEESTMDRIAQLPSPYTSCLAYAQSEEPSLDLLRQVRARRAAFWKQDGALRASVFLCAALVIIAIVLRVIHSGKLSTLDEQLITGADGRPGLVTEARRVDEAINTAAQSIEDDRSRVEFLATQRMPGHITAELMATISQLQNTETMPIFLEGFACYQTPDGFQVEILGYAKPLRKTSADIILDRFKQEITDSYPGINNIEPQSVNVRNANQPFHYVISIAGVSQDQRQG